MSEWKEGNRGRRGVKKDGSNLEGKLRDGM